MSRLILLLVLGGSALCLFGFEKLVQANRASPTAQVVSCANLEAGKLDDNAHIRLTNYILLTSLIVTEKKSSSNSWDVVWVPAIANNGEFIQHLSAEHAAGKNTDGELPTKIQVLIKSTTVHNDADLTTFEKRQEIDGLIINKIDPLNSQEKNTLADSFPSIDFNSCYIIEDGRQTMSPNECLVLMGCGVLLAGGGITLFVRRRERNNDRTKG